jgi:hypothetical protein
MSKHGGPRPKAGRKPRPEKARRYQFAGLRVTGEERRILEEAAESAGKSHAKWARGILLNAAWDKVEDGFFKK